MNIVVNRQLIDWPKPLISEEQLRVYADAKHSDDLWQETLYNPLKVTGVADLRMGNRFYSKAKP
jgi:hypothetical protein